jgi:hypothetical protein
VPRIGFIGSLADHDPRWTFSLIRPTERHLVATASGDGPVAHRLTPFDASAIGRDRLPADQVTVVPPARFWR